MFYLFCAVVLPLLTLFYASIQKISTAFPAASNFTTEHFYKAFTMNAAHHGARQQPVARAVDRDARRRC